MRSIALGNGFLKMGASRDVIVICKRALAHKCKDEQKVGKPRGAQTVTFRCSRCQ